MTCQNGDSVRLADLLEYTRDGEWGYNQQKEDTTLAYVIRGADFLDAQLSNLDELPKRYIENKKLANKRLRVGDILIETAGGTKGRPTGRVILLREALFEKSDLSFVCASFSRFLRVKKDACSPAYLYYHLSNMYNQGKMGMFNVQHTGVARFQYTDFANRTIVSLPSLPEQHAIASILSDIDEKVRINSQFNRVLDHIASLLFKRWFVDFEFPNEEGKPYKSSGGEMVYCNEIGKEVPTGWGATTLGELAEFTRGFSYSGAEKKKDNGDYVFMTLNSIYEGGGFKREFSYLTSDRLKERHLVKEGDIIIANTEQTKTGTLLGFPALVEFPNNYSKEVGCFSHHITKVSPHQDEMKYYLYYHLHHYQVDAVKYHTGSVIWALDVKGFTENEQVLIPSSRVLKAFSVFIDGIFNRKLLSNKQSTSLTLIRDTLLPKLMSGKIRVPILTAKMEVRQCQEQ